MLTRSAKTIFYITTGPLMKANAWLYRIFRAPKNNKSDIFRLHLGPGKKSYLPGWINIDANMFTAKCDLWLDLRNTLPFHDGTIDAVYSHHMIEHLPDMEGHLKDVFRVLKPGGVYRVGGPNGDSAIQKFIEDDKQWFGDWPDKYDSIGGRFVNLIFCRNEHLTILTHSFLKELGERAGFSEITKHLPVKETQDPTLFVDCLSTEHEQDFDVPHTLILELKK